MYKRRRSAHAGQPYGYTDQRVDVGMGAQGHAPMCRGLGCVPGSMSRRRRAQLASYPGTARGVPVDPPPPPPPPPPRPSGPGFYNSGSAAWCALNPELCNNGIPDPQKIAMAVNARGGKTCPDGSSYPADVPCPPSGGSSGGSRRRYRNPNLPQYYNSGSDLWCAYNPDLCSSGLPDPRSGESYASQASRMQRRMRR
jgi:hypothetical protein